MAISDSQSIPLKREIGKCICCGSTESLTDEHIVARGLGGPWLLQRASCRNCSQITSRFEREVLRSQFILPRTALKLPTYHPKNRPNSFAFDVVVEGRKQQITLSSGVCPPIFMMIELERPRCLKVYPYDRGVVVKGTTLHGPSDLKLVVPGIQGITFTAVLKGNEFERMLAKIAYGMIVLAYGPDALQQNHVLPCILGQKDNAGYWVGNSEREIDSLTKENALHRVTYTRRGDEVGAVVRLFASYSTPEYEVVVGKLRPGIDSPLIA